MDEDGSIPDRVNDDVPPDEMERMERFYRALAHLSHHGDEDARRVINGMGGPDAMRRQALITAAINNIPAVNRRIAKVYPAIVDFQAFIDRLRLEVIMHRLDGQS